MGLFGLFVPGVPRRIMYLDPLFSRSPSRLSSLSLSLSMVVVRSAPRLVLQSAREARVLPVPIVSCMINGTRGPLAGSDRLVHRLLSDFSIPR